MAVKHSIYTPMNPYYGSVSKDYCRESVHDSGRGVGFHQCGNKAKVFEDVELDDGTVERMGFCKVHSIEHQQAKAKARREKWDAQDRERKRSWAIRDLHGDIVKKVKEMHGLPESDTDGRDFCYHQLMNMAERLKKLESE